MKYLCQIYKAIKLSDFHWGTTHKNRGVDSTMCGVIICTLQMVIEQKNP